MHGKTLLYLCSLVALIIIDAYAICNEVFVAAPVEELGHECDSVMAL